MRFIINYFHNKHHTSSPTVSTVLYSLVQTAFCIVNKTLIMKHKLLYASILLCIFCTTQAQFGKMFGKKKAATDTTKTTDSTKVVDAPKAEDNRSEKKGGANLFTKMITKIQRS